MEVYVEEYVAGYFFPGNSAAMGDLIELSTQLFCFLIPKVDGAASFNEFIDLSVW